MGSNDLRTIILAASLIAGSLIPATATPQVPPHSEDPVLAACVAAAAAGNERDALSLARRAEAEYRRRAQADPPDASARFMHARVILQCRMPFAGFMAQGRLSGEANTLLEAALALDGTLWMARFTLAMNHFHTPEFLGRTGDAIREFERLAAQQGGDTRNPMYASTYLYLGDLHLRRRRTDEAVATWQHGADLFPDHAGLAERLSTHDASGAGLPPVADESSAEGAAYRLHEIVVTASGQRMDDPRSGVALRRIDVLTTPGGAADLMNALQTGPGMTAAGEGSDLYVRGGNPAETPVFVDGARLVYPGRYETLNGAPFGILDPSVLRSAYFSSGGFSARYGNALSGVVAVETEGRPAARSGQVALNSVQAGWSGQMPLGESAGVWGALRVTDGRAMLAMHGRGDEYSTAPQALEGMGALVLEPAAGVQVKATALVDGDRVARVLDAYGYTGPFAGQGENRMLGLSGRALRADGRAMLRGTVSHATRASAFSFGVLDRERTDRVMTARLDGTLEVGGRNRVAAGVEGAELHARLRGSMPSTNQLAPGSPAEERDATESAAHLGAYAEMEFAPHRDAGIVLGIRTDRLPGEDDWTVDPRIAVAMRRDDWTLRVGGGLFHQGRWRTAYAVPDSLSPAGTPRSATHLVAGAERQGEPAVKVVGFVKRYGDYVEAGEGPGIVAGSAVGADAVVRWRQRERLNGWLTYSLLRGRVELEDGRMVPSAVDVTHSLTAVGRLRVAEGWELGSTGRVGSGRPYTLDAASPHGDRLPLYARLDGRLTRFASLRSGTLVTYLEILNALDRANVAAYTSDQSGERRAVPTFFSSRTAVLGVSLSY
jgi:vitamin B12 transporter